MIKKQLKLNRLPAFSLVETMLYVFLLAAVLIAVGGFIREIFAARNKQQAILEVETESSYLLSVIDNDLKNAVTVTAPTDNGTGGVLTFTVNPGTVETHSYQLSGTNLTYSLNGAAGAQLNSNLVQITAFSISHGTDTLTNHTVTVTFTMKYINSANRGDLRYQKDFRKTITLRPNT